MIMVNYNNSIIDHDPELRIAPIPDQMGAGREGPDALGRLLYFAVDDKDKAHQASHHRTEPCYTERLETTISAYSTQIVITTCKCEAWCRS